VQLKRKPLKIRRYKMKKILAVTAIISILAVGAIAFAHGPAGGWGGGPMMGPGYGGHMMGPGYGGHMTGRMGWGGQGYGTDQKFLDETADLRKELHEKRFEYMEAGRDPKTTNDTIAKLEKEIYGLQEKIREKAPRTAYGTFGNQGHCW
jgi:hypothetical protein